MESQKDYVVRKLQSDEFNHSTISKLLRISRDTLCRIEKGVTKNPSSRTVEVLHNYFRKVGD